MRDNRSTMQSGWDEEVGSDEAETRLRVLIGSLSKWPELTEKADAIKNTRLFMINGDFF